MKRALTFLLAASLLYCSCDKKDTEQTVPVPTTSDPNAMKYSISGLTDLSLKSTDDTTIAIGIAHIGGKQEKLTLSVIDLPANVSAVFQTSSGIPSFGTLLTYSTNNAAGGDYKIKIKAVSASDSVNTYEVTLKIAPPPPPVDTYGCIKTLAGDYNQDGFSNTVTIATVSGTKNHLQVTNIGDLSYALNISADCQAQIISVLDGLQQPNGSPVVTGNGSFNSNGDVTITYKKQVIVSGGMTLEDHSVVLHKK